MLWMFGAVFAALFLYLVAHAVPSFLVTILVCCIFAVPLYYAVEEARLEEARKAREMRKLEENND